MINKNRSTPSNLEDLKSFGVVIICTISLFALGSFLNLFLHANDGEKLTAAATVFTGILAISAALITVKQMRNQEQQAEKRHREQLEKINQKNDSENFIKYKEEFEKIAKKYEDEINKDCKKSGIEVRYTIASFIHNHTNTKTHKAPAINNLKFEKTLTIIDSFTRDIITLNNHNEPTTPEDSKKIIQLAKSLWENSESLLCEFYALSISKEFRIDADTKLPNLDVGDYRKIAVHMICIINDIFLIQQLYISPPDYIQKSFSLTERISKITTDTSSNKIKTAIDLIKKNQ